MSQLLARILLSMLIIPLAGIVYLSAFFVMLGMNRGMSFRWREEQTFTSVGLVTWLFMALSWVALWRPLVRWTSQRVVRTFVGGAAAAAVAAGVGGLTGWAFDDDVAWFMASITAPILWLAGTVLIWRETREERAERLRNANSDAVVCPTCGYNLTGLTESRCPECGSKFTLNDLLAAQPARKMAEIEEA